MNRGDAFYPKVGPGKFHIWVVLSEEEGRKVVCANFTSMGASLEDRTCVVEAGDYSELSHRSCVVYEAARLIPVSEIERWISCGMAEYRRPVSEDVLEAMVDGALVSDLSSVDLSALLERQRNAS